MCSSWTRKRTPRSSWPVSIERSTDTLDVISSGLSEGEHVVTDGQSRLQNGSQVNVRALTNKQRPQRRCTTRCSQVRARRPAADVGLTGRPDPVRSAAPPMNIG